MKRRDFCRNLAWVGAGLAAATGCTSRKQQGAGKGSDEEAEAQGGAPFLYILRLAMVPDFHEEERLEALSTFCREAQIDDVAFILWAEELNTGHPTLQEVEPWLRMVERVKPRLAAQGVTTSLNPWVGAPPRGSRQGTQTRAAVPPDGRFQRPHRLCHCVSAVPGLARASSAAIRAPGTDFSPGSSGWTTTSGCTTTHHCSGAAASANCTCRSTPDARAAGSRARSL